MHSFKIQHVLLFFSSSNSNCYHEQLAQKSSTDTSPSSSSFLPPTPTRVETNPTRETKKRFVSGERSQFSKGSALVGRSSAKRRRDVASSSSSSSSAWVPLQNPPLRRRRAKRRRRRRERERERDFNLHEAAVSSSGNYSAGLATREPRRGRHVRGKICSWRKRKRRSGRTMPRDWDCARESNRRNLFLVEIWPETRRDSNKGTLLYRILIRSRSKRWSRMEKESEKLFQISEQWSKTSEEALIKVGCLRGKK